MPIGIRPTVNYPFQKILGDPQHENVTLHFLNAVLDGDPEFTEVKIISPITNPKSNEAKRPVLDVLAKDVTGRIANIEMQSSVRGEFRERMVYYNSMTFTSQLKPGDGYNLLNSTISISVLHEVMFADVAGFHLDFRLRSENNEAKLTDLIQLHTLELPKYVDSIDNEVFASPLEKWIYFFRFAERMEPQEIGEHLNDRIFFEAAEVLQMIAKNPEERLLYELSLKRERDIESMVAQSREEGLEEGLEKGKLTGTIQTLQSILGVPITPDAELQELDREILNSQIENLQSQIRGRDG